LTNEIAESVLASRLVASMIPSSCPEKAPRFGMQLNYMKVGTRLRSGRLTDNNAVPVRAGGLRQWVACQQTGRLLKAALWCDNAVVEAVLPFRTRRVHPSQSPRCSPRHCVKFLTCRTVELYFRFYSAACRVLLRSLLVQRCVLCTH
jgi:hypothetical protein